MYLINFMDAVRSVKSSIDLTISESAYRYSVRLAESHYRDAMNLIEENIKIVKSKNVADKQEKRKVRADFPKQKNKKNTSSIEPPGNFERLKPGMTFSEVCSILGNHGELFSHAGEGKNKVETYFFKDTTAENQNIIVTFLNSQLEGKAFVHMYLPLEDSFFV